MRALVVALLALGACSKQDETVKEHFCQNVRISFLEMMESSYRPIEQTIEPPNCARIMRAGDYARGVYMGFRAAAAPFRSRPEVQRVRDALDGESARHNMLDELGEIECVHDSQLTPEYLAGLRKTVASLRTRFRAAVDACTRGD